MASEGMVDALRRAHRMVKPGGCVADLHPTADRALVEVGAQPTGEVDAADAPSRHTAADAALAQVIDERWFAAEQSFEFVFYTYGESADELRRHVESTWRNARIPADTMRRTTDALRRDPEARPRVIERVRATRLRPLPRAWECRTDGPEGWVG